MFDEKAHCRLDEGERKKRIIEELAKIKSFLRQQNPQAYLKAQTEKKVISPSPDRLPSPPDLFLQSKTTQVQIPPSPQKQARERVDQKRELIDSKRRTHQGLSSMGVPLKSKGDQSPSKFHELIKWMSDNFAEYPLLPAYRVQSPSHDKKTSSAVLIVTGDSSSSSDARNFAENVADALTSRAIATTVIPWGRWEDLDAFDPSALKIIIAPNGAQEQLRQRVNEPTPPILPIDWGKCALDMGQKAELWKTIKLHLRQEAR